MLIGPHIIVGAVIGNYIDSPFWVITLSVLSHFVLDAIPHYDSGTIHSGEKVIVFDKRDWALESLDFIISLSVFIYAYNISHGSWLVVMGMLATFLVDVFDKIFLIRIKNGKLTFCIETKNPIIKFLNNMHKKVNFNLQPKYWYFGVLTQIVILVGGFLCLKG